MSDNIFKTAAASTSLGLAMIGFNSGALPSNSISSDWKPIIGNELVYTTARSSTYWSGGDRRIRLKKIIKRFSFIKAGRGKPTANHEHFLNIWI